MMTDLVSSDLYWMKLMEVYCDHVMTLGYQPADCLMLHGERDDGWPNGSRSWTHELRCMGRSVVTITVTWGPAVDYQWTVTTTESAPAWPERLP